MADSLLENAPEPQSVENVSGIPEPFKPWLAILVAHALRGDVTRPLREMEDQALRHMDATIALNHITLPHYLQQWGFEPLQEPDIWTGAVLPAIRAELERRQRPKRVYGDNSPIARLKALDIAQVAGKVTTLTGTGNRLKARCPLHKEKTASFYLYLDTNRWRCFGACADGGDVVDLIQRLRRQEQAA